jgi:hypothetical protein
MLKSTLKVVGVTTNGQLMHTLRQEKSGNWQNFMGDLEIAVAKNEVANFIDVGITNFRDPGTVLDMLGNGELSTIENTGVYAIDTTGKCYYYNNHKKGKKTDAWLNFGLLLEDDKRTFFAVDVTHYKQEYHYIPLLYNTATSIGNLEICTWSYSDGSSNGKKRVFRDRFTLPTLPELVDVSATIIDFKKYFFAATKNGAIINLFTDNATITLDSLTLQLPNQEKAIKVSCAAIKNKIHVTAISNLGNVYHIIFKEQAVWGNVEVVVGEAGSFVDVSCACVDEVLHVAVITNTGSMLHTIRKKDGSWQKNFGDVETQTGESGNFKAIALG